MPRSSSCARSSPARRSPLSEPNAPAPAAAPRPAAAPAPGGAPTGPRVKHKRKLSNYLIDRSLQLRYILIVTILSGVIAASLGYLIYKQRHAASASIEA